ncbi:5'-nucleotidase C-terminal domain-containing protein [Tenacibaculum amylolyticum]|uniref:5'-nucleotidase C-terminal domain-containing protein n=1 Tax=Tenacibaculum amylolyticum TaxID=104269 RepID=UPI00389553BF
MKLSYYLLCFFLVFTSCKKTKTDLTKITAKTIAIDSTITSAAAIDSMVAPYKEKLAAEMQEILSYTAKDLVKNDGDMQSSLGNLMADMTFDMANPIFKEITNKSIDFALFNYGGIRATIPKGNITKASAFKLMPFENELVVVELTGKKINELIHYFIKNKKAHPLSKSISLIINDNKYDLKIHGDTFDETKNYTVLTSDYLQSGGDKMVFFKDPVKLTKLDYKVRDAIIHYLKKVDTIQTTIDNRVILK